MQAYTTLLKDEMIPALGVTEVGAIALAASRAAAEATAGGGKVCSIRMTMNGGMYKKRIFLCDSGHR